MNQNTSFQSMGFWVPKGLNLFLWKTLVEGIANYELNPCIQEGFCSVIDDLRDRKFLGEACAEVL